MLIRIPVASLSDLEPQRGAGYVAALRAESRQSGDFLWIESEAHTRLKLAHPILSMVQGPEVKTSLLTKFARLRRELAHWLKSGASLATRDVRRARLAICQLCPFYNASGNLGLGECQAPGCGCTRAKLALATARCPLKPPKW